jgi:hemerythrin superfamily protein
VDLVPSQFDTFERGDDIVTISGLGTPDEVVSRALRAISGGVGRVGHALGHSLTKEHAMTDGFELLAGDHRTVERLFETYMHDNEDSVAREICEQLTLHARLEEAALYPALRRYVDGGDDLADEAEQEHSAVKTLIARIYDSPPDGLLDLVSELRHEVEHHVEREESELFPLMRESGVDARLLGAELEGARRVASTNSQ